MSGTVKNLGSEVEIFARGEQFEAFFTCSFPAAPALPRIDSVEVTTSRQEIPEGFFILPRRVPVH